MGNLSEISFFLAGGEILGLAGLRVRKDNSGASPHRTCRRRRDLLRGNRVRFRSSAKAPIGIATFLVQVGGALGLAYGTTFFNSLGKVRTAGSSTGKERGAHAVFVTCGWPFDPPGGRVSEATGRRWSSDGSWRIARIFLLDEPTRSGISARRRRSCPVSERIRNGASSSPGLDDHRCAQTRPRKAGFQEYERKDFSEHRLFLDMQGFGQQERRGGRECQAV